MCYKNPILEFLEKVSYKFKKGYPDLNDGEDVLLLEQEISKLLEEEFELYEVNLSPTQIEKPYPKNSEFFNKYQDRGERFLEKIENGDEFELSNGTQIIIDPKQSNQAVQYLKNKNYKALGGRIKLFFDQEGNSYSLSNFKKTKEFGSGSGIGGGSANTDIAESTQCLFNGLTYHVIKGNITEEDLTEENYNKAFEYCDVTSTLEDMIAFAEDPSWRSTFINTSNKLLQHFPGNYTFHRGSALINDIYNSYKQAKTKQKLSLNSDKWNPADIWMVSSDLGNVTFENTLKELNYQLLNLFEEKKLIGVSLKKLAGEGKVTIHNIEKQDLEPIEIENINVGLTNKGAVLTTSKGKLTFRTFNFTTNFAGEITGKAAAHGKIGHGPLNDILSDKYPPIPPSKEIKALFEEGDKNTIKTLFDNYNKLAEDKMGWDAFMKIFNVKDLDWKVSKYLSLQVSVYLVEDPDYEIINDLFQYASSSTRFSSVFVKVM